MGSNGNGESLKFIRYLTLIIKRKLHIYMNNIIINSLISVNSCWVAPARQCAAAANRFAYYR